MKGRTSASLDSNNPIGKWTNVSRVLREKKIGILCLQETHLNANHEDNINALFGNRIKVFNSSDPSNPSAAAGVAFVINHEKVSHKSLTTTEIIPGRAMLLTIKWHNDHTLKILNIYAPNSPRDHPPFWQKIGDKLASLGTTSIDMMLGDFNLVEDPIDRAPAHNDDPAATDALRTLKQSLNLQDTWRHENPSARKFTFISNTHSMSRLDRIYAKTSLTTALYDWETTDTSIPSDHRMVLTRLIPPKTPFIGPGRWTLPLTLINDKKLMNDIESQGIELQEKLRLATHGELTPQRLWTDFKVSITTIAKKSGKVQLSKITNHIKALKEDISKIEQDPRLDAERDVRSNAAFLRQELEHLENKKYKNARARAQAQWQDKGEAINKYWSKVHTPKRPRDIIYALYDPQKRNLTTRSSEMARIAHDYHNELQTTGLLPYDNLERRNAQSSVLQQIPNDQKLNDNQSDLHNEITEEQVTTALRAVKNGTATGLDGLPYELWKAMHERHEQKCKLDEPSFNIVECLTIVYNNIQRFGTDPTTDFSIGWMCPLYKKKDRTKIENYRPITLLNTDYKIMTKTLATQLAKHATSLLHPDQTGFVPTRSIFNPIRLAETMCAYADYMEEDGVIVALDQEKAYDKIDHRYLINTLKTFQLPDLFVSTVETLYKHAYTAVVVNGTISDKYRVTRGVRQGDPLSCLLFNLAIEPLAASIRNSTELTGFTIPGAETKVIINLYADDTTVYLSKTDRYETLESILTLWCTASGAKFNLEKTEIIPIGTKRHRDRVIQTRRLHPDDTPLTNGIRIAEEGHPTRILGAWIGNNIEQPQTWTTVVDKIKTNLDKWSTSRPTLDAKRLIIQMIVGGMTQFLTKAQGMPPQISKSLHSMIRDFIWDNGRTPPGLSMEQLSKTREAGGINLFSIEARNQAIDLTWLQTYLDTSSERPAWAFVIDATINCIQKDGIRNPNDINTFLTTRRPSGRQKKNTRQIPRPVTNLLKTAKQWNLTFAPLKLSKSMKRQMPAWFHIGVPPRLYHKKKTECLRTIHGATRIRDLLKTARRLTKHTSKHLPMPTCHCRACRRDRNRGCTNPHRCAAQARDITGNLEPKFNPYDAPNKDGLTLTHHRKEKNQRADIRKGDEIIFDPSVTTRNNLEECFRVMGPQNLETTEPAHRIQNPRPENGEQGDEIKIYTDGSCMNNGKQNAKCGAGIWFGNNHPRNRAIRVPGPHQSNQTGEIAVIAIALTEIEPTKTLTILSDSMYAINGLTKHLRSWEDRGWINISNAEWFRLATYQLRRRAAPTFFKWIKGHDGTIGNEGADELAGQGANKELADDVNTETPENFTLRGIKLNTLTQALAYQTITRKSPKPYQRSALMNLDITRHAVHEWTGSMETDKTIWNSLRNPDIRRTIQTFLYKAMHGALRIGGYWSKIPNYEHRARCSLCDDTEESMEHILTECSSPERRIVWSETQRIWPTNIEEWRQPAIGQILGCGALSATNNEDQNQNNRETGGMRLRRILISESAHLIWVLRCGRVIGGRQHSDQTIRNQWRDKINTRLDTDRRIAKTRKKPKITSKIAKTWEPVIKSDNPLPKNWVENLEVLVGITLA